MDQTAVSQGMGDQAVNRRSFVKYMGALAVASSAGNAAVPDWKKQVGLELYTVRDLTPKDYEGTLKQVAEIGYTEVEPASANYGGMEPKQFRAMLDRYRLSMPSTHIGATDGPGLEKEGQ